MNKKTISLFLAACLTLLLLLPYRETAAAAVTSGTDGGVSWMISGNVLTINALLGTDGRMRSYTYTSHAPWQESPAMASVDTVIVKEGVKGLGALAFYSQNLHLKKVVIPGSVDVIPAYFCHSVTIDALYINEGVRSIEGCAFYGVTETVYLAKSVEVLPLSAFGINNSTGNGTISYVSQIYGYSDSPAQLYASNYIKAIEATNTAIKMWTDGKKYSLDADLDGQADPDPKIAFTALDDASIFDGVTVPASLSLSVKKSAKLNAVVPEGLSTVSAYSGNEGEVKISYKSKNKKVASVDANGKITGKKKGKTTVTTTMKLENGTQKKFTTKVTVK